MQRVGSANRPRRLARWLCFPALAILFSLNVGQAAENPNALSSYTKQLIDLMNLFEKLDKATADRMAANERYLMAKAMLRLSGGFYRLKEDKARFARAVLLVIDSPRSAYDPMIYESSVLLQRTLNCLAAQFRKDGPRIGALVGFDGPSVARQFEIRLDAKARTVDKIVNELGLDPAAPDLKEVVVKDAETAWDTADALYRKSVEIAHSLDSSVVPPDRPFCEFPPS
ncbi:hypothetical protein [Bradyrhizobium sp. 195]|uniref:hypothetical protein n=1 Tax=Bradyrhizobium sp. 195 TaxID=2782662 RepID=UPI002001143F|nr:hypothetical protein [Bradyrhizobium sp. 195]UPK26756.1 hypothetical protein IVB26_36940 [Bradyrhizobium sp. 195]